VGPFADPAEVYTHIGGLLDEIDRDDELAERLRKADTILRFSFTEPVAQITVKMIDGEPGQVDCGESSLEPEVDLSLSADLAHRFWLGLVNPTVAIGRGEMTARGPVAKVLRLVPLVEPAFAIYARRLEDAGRDDLLAPLREQQPR
jgi:hypothetical protein